MIHVFRQVKKYLFNYKYNHIRKSFESYTFTRNILPFVETTQGKLSSCSMGTSCNDLYGHSRIQAVATAHNILWPSH
ncbi:Uncharacterized protein TCM_024566 [Theobroma cacao]|uniref:Uncharacterized protein n=1 Tax=Theobroma cacao TaxID=3641 RepID=A0A061EVU2_THECC|nr:Uncharacterized protein TCM_024566 [Theobroma cacao]